MPENFEMKHIEIGGLQTFNQDFDDDGQTPESWREFRERVKELDAFLFVTPEYNRSYPAVLKNAIDIASRPYGANLWSGKPGAIVGVSPGKMGGFASVAHLRQSLSFLNVYLMQRPELYIGDAGALLAEEPINDESRKFLAEGAAAFAAWVERNK
jgi:chromate reductase